jgi:hypothetical protein
VRLRRTEILLGREITGKAGQNIYLYIHTYTYLQGDEEDLYVQFYGMSFIHLYKEYEAHPAIDQITYIDVWKKYCKTACPNLPEDEHVGGRNMSLTL